MSTQVSDTYAKHQQEHEHLHPAFGPDRFGVIAERIARFFGTPQYILGQTAVVICWIIFNGFELFIHFDKYPFILLNLAFSLQAAYAAPLILLAQTRQADRDKAQEDASAKHREELSANQIRLLQENTKITEQVAKLSSEIDDLTKGIHARLVGAGGS